VNHERILVFLLRAGGVILVTAFFAAVMPTSWMAASHTRIGLGVFPEHALTEYLTRSISLLYGFHGVVLLAISRDVRRFRPLVRVMGYQNLLFGPAILAIDFAAGMPMWWTLNEGPPITILGAAILWLSAKVPDGR
jgi:hypothetical protein